MDNGIFNSLRNTKLFKGIQDEELMKICNSVDAVEKRYAPKQIIINQGEPVNRIGILKRGSVISTKQHYDGNEQILRIYRQGEVFSLDSVSTTLATSPVTVVSQSESSVVFIPYGKIFAVQSISSKAKETVHTNCGEILGNELIRLMYKIDVLSKRTLQERILTFLSLLREKSDGDTFEIDMNQEQLAQYLCVNRSVLSKELNQMRKCGLIDYKGKWFTLFQK